MSVSDERRIFLITGVPGAGKSSVSDALMRRFEYGLHIPVDDLREWVVSGLAQPLPLWTDETSRQFRLARRSAADVARNYAEAGFAVAIDDVTFPLEAEALYVKPLAGQIACKVLLHPTVEIAQERNANRTNKNFDTSFLAETIGSLHEQFVLALGIFERRGWQIIDASNLDIEGTVDEILRRCAAR